MKKISYLNAAFRKGNLLFSDTILCFCYALCYVLLIVVPFSQEATKSSFYPGGLVLFIGDRQPRFPFQISGPSI